MAKLLSVPEQHMENWGAALIAKNKPWTTTPEYHQWGAQDVTQEKSKELAQDYGNWAAGAFELAAPFLAAGSSIPFYDIPQAFGKYEDEPEKYEVNNKWDKINAYFPDLQGTTVSGILNAIDMEDPLSAAYNRFIGAGKPVFNRMFGQQYDKNKNFIVSPFMRDRRATQQGIAQIAMQKKIQAAEATAAQQVRQNIQRYGSGDRPNTGINRPGGGRGQSPTGGDVSGTPFARGGIVNLLYGGFI
jgi:hypothetical protein